MRRILLSGAIGLTLVAFLAGAAVAQGTIDAGGAVQWLRDIVITVVTAVIGALSAWGVYLIQKYTGVRIDAERANELTLAAQRQAASLIADGFVKLQSDGKIVVPHAALAEAVNEVLKAVPAAVVHFGLDKAEIAKRVVDYIPMVPETSVVSGTATGGVVVAAAKV